MGLLKKIRDFFIGSKEETVEEENPYKKEMVAREIMDLVGRIAKIDSFDSEVRRFHDRTSGGLQREYSLSELNELKEYLEKKYNRLIELAQKEYAERKSYEIEKWTGQKPKGMTDHDFDRLQRDDR